MRYRGERPLASLGHETWGIDSSSHAIVKAKKKARQRRLKVTFLVRDALQLSDLGRTFDTVIDTGHVSREEIKAVFGTGWRINYVRAARFETIVHPIGAQAWLPSITRL